MCFCKVILTPVPFKKFSGVRGHFFQKKFGKYTFSSKWMFFENALVLSYVPTINKP